MRKPILHDEKQRGQAIVLIAAVMVALIAALGLAIDGGGLFLLYRDVQNATDSAALTAAYAMCTGEPVDVRVEDNAAQNGFRDGVNGATVNITYPPAVGSMNYITVEIQAEKPSYFIQIVYPDDLIVRASTTSQCQLGTDFGFPSSAAVVQLMESGCAGGGSAPLDANGNNTTAIYGDIYINHSDVNCDSVDILGGSNEFYLDGKLCVKGSNVNTHGDTLTNYAPPHIAVAADIEAPCNDVPQLTGAAALDPLGLSANPPSCAGMPSYTFSSLGSSNDPNNPLVIQPGTYDNLNVGSNKYVEMAPGIYCVGESITLHGDLTSQHGGVTIYQTCTTCRIYMNAQASLDIEAPTSGDYAGLLIYTRSTNTSNGHLFSGGVSLNMTGTIYSPQAECNAKGGSGTIIYAQFICYKFAVSGNSELVIHHLPAAVYQVPPTFGVTE